MKDVYNEIYNKMYRDCREHEIHYGYNYACKYSASNDAIGLAYYYIRDYHSENKELLEYAYKLFMK